VTTARTSAAASTAAVFVTATTIKFYSATKLSSIVKQRASSTANATTLPKLATTLSSTICKI
jgi:hypothetical protein